MMRVIRGLRILARREDYGNSIGLSFQSGKGDSLSVATNIEFHPLAEGEPIEATAHIDTETAQGLMDELWDCGLRPTQGKGSAGQLDAVKYHLEDMRALVFKDRG